MSLKQFDVSNDFRITSLDALRVINEISRRANLGFASGEQTIAPWLSSMTFVDEETAEETAEEDALGAVDVVQGFATSDRVAVHLAGQLAQQAISSPRLDAIDVSEGKSDISAELVDLAIDKWAWTDWAE